MISSLPNTMFAVLEQLFGLTFYEISFFTFLFLFLYKYVSKNFKRDANLVKFSKNLPGPPGVPLLGNILDFSLEEPNIIEKILEYTKKYGHIYRLWFGTHLIIVLSKAEDIEVVLRNSKLLGKAKSFRSFQKFWGDSIMSGSVHIWKKNRKQLQPVFGSGVVGSYVPKMNEKIYNLVGILKKHINGPEFDAWDYLPYLSFDIVTKTCTGVDIDRECGRRSTLKFHDCVKTATYISFSKIFNPLLNNTFVKFFNEKKEQKIQKAMVNLVHSIIADKLKVIKNSNTQDEEINEEFNSERKLKSYLRTSYDIQKEVGDEKIMYDEVITILSGGTDTVAIVNCFFLLAIAIHQDIQDKLYEEIYEVFGDGDREADNDDLIRLPYLDQVLKECMRRFTILPFIFRDVEENCKIGTNTLPPGTEIMISILGVHFNPEYYPDPWKFNPENFSSEAIEKRYKSTFLAFSAGSRNCIGQNYAMMEMKLTLIALLRNFSFHTKVRMEDIQLNMGFLLTSKNGYKISIKPRQKNYSN